MRRSIRTISSSRRGRYSSYLSNTTEKPTKWCLQSLAELNGQKLALQDRSSNTISLSLVSRQILSNSSAKNRPSKAVAKFSLSDVCIRLALQHAVCIEMIEQVTRMATDKEQLVGTEIAINKQRKIIKAVNVSIAVDKQKEQQLILQQLCVLEEQKSLKLLHSLRRLHADTLQLAENLLTNSIICERFNNADQNIVEATMEQIRSRHANTVEDLAEVVVALRKVSDVTDVHKDNDEHQHKKLLLLVESFLHGRCSIQLLCDHYVGFCKGRPHGEVSANVNLWEVAHEASLEAQYVCDANLGMAPEVIVQGERNNVPLMHLIRPWVHHSLVEMCKNAMASSVEKSKIDTPPIQLHIAHNSDQRTTTIQVIDQGIGLNDHSRGKAFTFAETSHARRWDRLLEQQSYAPVREPLASLGVGLPFSRALMQIFGGDVTLTENSNAPGCTATLLISNDPTVLEKEASMASPGTNILNNQRNLI